MRKNFGVQPWLYPMPVLILSAYDEKGVPAAMAAGWGGIRDQQNISVCVMDYHKTTRAIRHSGAFTASIATLPQLAACDYLGTVSGNEVPDKVARAGLHTLKSGFVNAPLIEELPMALECELVCFEPDTGYLMGRIVNVNADPSILDEKGNIDGDRLQALSYDPVAVSYRSLGRELGKATQMGKEFL